LEIQPLEERLPNRPKVVPPPEPAANRPLTDLQKRNIKQREERLEAFLKDRNQWLERRAQASRQRALNNVELAKDVRNRFLEALGKEN
jgi:hypothetical protein